MPPRGAAAGPRGGSATTEEEIRKLLARRPSVRVRELAVALGLSERAVQASLKGMRRDLVLHYSLRDGAPLRSRQRRSRLAAAGLDFGRARP